MKNIQRVMSVIIILCFVVIAIPCITVEVNAAAQNELVKHAKTHLGDKYNNFYIKNLLNF